MKTPSAITAGLLALASLTSAVPTATPPDVTTSVDPSSNGTVEVIRQSDFTLIQYYEQYAAAAYCGTNLRGELGPLSCSGDVNRNARTCDLVERNKVTTILKFIDAGVTGTSGFVAVDSVRGNIVVSFRGTQSLLNIGAIFNLTMTPLDVCGTNTNCKGSGGFFQSWVDVRGMVISAINDAFANNATLKARNKIVVTGHSLGGATAAIAAVDLRNRGFNVDMPTFGSPRTGNRVFAKQGVPQRRQQGRNFRVAHVGNSLASQDIVPKVPNTFTDFNGNYAHILPELDLTDNFFNRPLDNFNINRVNTDDNTITFATFISLIANQAAVADAHNHYFNGIANCSNTAVIDIIRANKGKVQATVDDLTARFPSPGQIQFDQILPRVLRALP